jgi:CRISPR/Cas system endoribonuclease Cas6 (RAMP superfamily)
VIRFQQFLRDIACKKQINDFIQAIFLQSVRSIVLIQFFYQDLYRSQSIEFIATHFDLKVINVARCEDKIDDIDEIDDIDIRHEIDKLN